MSITRSTVRRPRWAVCTAAHSRTSSGVFTSTGDRPTPPPSLTTRYSACRPRSHSNYAPSRHIDRAATSQTCWPLRADWHTASTLTDRTMSPTAGSIAAAASMQQDRPPTRPVYYGFIAHETRKFYTMSVTVPRPHGTHISQPLQRWPNNRYWRTWCCKIYGIIITLHVSCPSFEKNKKGTLVQLATIFITYSVNVLPAKGQKRKLLPVIGNPARNARDKIQWNTVTGMQYTATNCGTS